MSVLIPVFGTLFLIGATGLICVLLFVFFCILWDGDWLPKTLFVFLAIFESAAVGAAWIAWAHLVTHIPSTLTN